MERWREDFHQKGKIYQQDAEADLGLLQHPKMERFVIIVNGFQPVTIITKRSILYFHGVFKGH